MMKEGEPATPMGRLCLLPEHNHVINCAIQFNDPINVDTLKYEITNSIMLKIPRFACILMTNPRDGLEHWKQVDVDLDDHIIINNPNDKDDNVEHQVLSDEDVINEYLADMAISTPMKMDKPLWEFHILYEQKCVIMRIHHAIADGMSLMSLLWTMGRSPPVDNVDKNKKATNNINNYNNNNGGKKKNELENKGIWGTIVCIWYTIVYGLILIGRCLWINDKKNVVGGFSGLEFWPRKVVTAKFKISDMKSIKKVIPNATVNDVLCGILWCGLTRYLNISHSKVLEDGVQITGMCPYNLRLQPGVQDLNSMLTKNTRTPWGNRFSVILLPFTYNKITLDALSYVKLAKDMMTRKKQSMEARLSYNVVSLCSSLLGSKIAGLFYYNLFCNTSFLMSNIAGPFESILIGGNLVTSLRVTSSSQPHAMTMHMVSYGEWANLQIQVAKDVILEPKMLAQCFEDSLLDMKNAADGPKAKSN